MQRREAERRYPILLTLIAQSAVDVLDEILTIVLDPAVGDDAVGPLLRERVGLDRMRAASAARQQRLPRDHGHLTMLDASMPYLRQFAPDVLAAVGFAGETYRRRIAR